MSKEYRLATASIENLYKIFTVPEQENSTLATIDQSIAENLSGFLREHVVASDATLDDIERDFAQAKIPEVPLFVSDYSEFLLDKLVSQSVHTAAPGFIGHMTTPLPYFMLPLARIMIALNQNPVKIETSKAFTPMERQVLGMLHHLIYSRSDEFYQRTLHDSELALGSFCSGGTISNITALWVARNRLFPATENFQGLAQEGLAAALQHADLKRLVLLVSERGHYSLGKAADTLGIGRNNLISIPTDANYKVDVTELARQCKELKNSGAGIVALVGVAGATETGIVDPLNAMADVAEEYGAHFHVDAAWGGPTLLSSNQRSTLAGIERADSVTIDAHKQMYVPMGAGMTLFKDPEVLTSIQHHAEYILRAGSKDLGRYTLEGSRPGISMLVHAAFHIIGREGYELLIDQNFARAREFAALIEAHEDFELTTQPELNILTYRYVPAAVQQLLRDSTPDKQNRINALLDRGVAFIQKVQRARGSTFVSRTRFENHQYQRTPLSVFRAVIANPMTQTATLQQVLDEQLEIANSKQVKSIIEEIDKLS